VEVPTTGSAHAAARAIEILLRSEGRLR
jgi:hypothetical protein